MKMWSEVLRRPMMRSAWEEEPREATSERGRELGDYSGVKEKRLFQEERNGHRVKCSESTVKWGLNGVNMIFQERGHG